MFYDFIFYLFNNIYFLPFFCILNLCFTFLGKETIKLGKKNYNTLHFNFSSTDKKLTKGKKLNTDVWYDEETLNWVKATFKKKGSWEYKLISID